jgi:spermidine synthase
MNNPSPRQGRRPGSLAPWHTSSGGGGALRGTVTLLLGLLLLGGVLFLNRTTVLFQGEGEFGTVRVVERRDGVRALHFGGSRNRQSALVPGRPLELELEYSRVGMVGLALMPPDPRILFVGLGGGAMPMYVRAVLPDARIDVVEIDPLVVEVATAYFGFTPDPAMRVHVGDGRAFIEDAPLGSWDLIVLDAFSESGIPRALTTRPFLEAVRARLAPGGIVVSNIPTAHALSPSMFATYDAVFPEVQRLEVRRHRQQILVASGGRLLDRGTLVEAARALAARRALGFDLPHRVERGLLPSTPEGGEVLEDGVGAGSGPPGTGSPAHPGGGVPGRGSASAGAGVSPSPTSRISNPVVETRTSNRAGRSTRI